MEQTLQQRTRLSEAPEETINQLTHGAGLALSIAGAYKLLSVSPTDAYLRLGCWIYALALVALYAASTLSHSWVSGPIRTRYRTIDQICIFTVMAATYTPVSLYACRDGWWNLPLVLMWLGAGLGTYLKLRVTRHEMVPVWFYVGMGWLPVLSLPRLAAVSGREGLFWIIAGGACYMLGVLFLANDSRVRYFHAVWHLLVILGSACHYVAIHTYIGAAV